MSGDIKWIKIVIDIFDDEKIMLIESMPDADSIIVIWFKLLCLAGKNNNKGVFTLNGRIAYTDEMLSTIFRRQINTIRLALKIFEQYGMIEIIEGVITIPNWGKHQTLDKIDAQREYQRKYMAAKRAEQKLLASCKPNCEPNSEIDSKPNVRSLELDSKDSKDSKELDKIPYQAIIDYLNKKAAKKFKATDKHKEVIRARWNEKYSLEDFYTVIDIKCDEWKETDQAQYLRPLTLFSNKFDGYLNQTSAKSVKEEKWDERGRLIK